MYCKPSNDKRCCNIFCRYTGLKHHRFLLAPYFESAQMKSRTRKLQTPPWTDQAPSAARRGYLQCDFRFPNPHTSSYHLRIFTMLFRVTSKSKSTNQNEQFETTIDWNKRRSFSGCDNHFNVQDTKNAPRMVRTLGTCSDGRPIASIQRPVTQWKLYWFLVDHLMKLASDPIYIYICIYIYLYKVLFSQFCGAIDSIQTISQHHSTPPAKERLDQVEVTKQSSIPWQQHLWSQRHLCTGGPQWNHSTSSCVFRIYGHEQRGDDTNVKNVWS